MTVLYIMYYKPRRGFTLVEVLVTIAVTSVLLGILLPAIAGARHAARRTVCMSNLRQAGTLLRVYMDERSDGVLPAFGTSWNALHPADRESAIGLWKLFGEIGGFDVPSPPLSVALEHIGVCPSDPGNAEQHGYSYRYDPGSYMVDSRAARVNPELAPQATQRIRNSPPGLRTIIRDGLYILPLTPGATEFDSRLYHPGTPDSSITGNALFLDGHVDWDEINATLNIR